MASSSDCQTVIEWNNLLEPLWSTQLQSDNELRRHCLDLCAAIIKCQKYVLEQKEDHRPYFDIYFELAAHYLSHYARLFTVAKDLEIVNRACCFILKYFLEAMKAAQKTKEAEYLHEDMDDFLAPIISLCGSGGSAFHDSQVTFLIETIETKMICTPLPKDSEPAKSEPIRNDVVCVISDKLVMPLREETLLEDPNQQYLPQLVANMNLDSSAASNETVGEINRLFIKANRDSLQSLHAGDTFLDLCLALSSVKATRAKIEDALAGKPFAAPATYSEATQIKNTLELTLDEVNLISNALNLPILEPLSPTTLEKLSILSMCLLYSATSHATANSILSLGSATTPKCAATAGQGQKEEDSESEAVALVELVLNMHGLIGNVIKNSTRAGGQVYLNYALAGAWVLVTGLQSHITTCTTSASSSSSASDKSSSHLREDKGRSPSKSRESSGGVGFGSARSGLIKFQQSFGVLTVALTNRTLTLLADLFEDLNLEVCSGNNSEKIEPSPITISGYFSAQQRVAKILTAAPLNQLFFYLALVSYRKACTLKRIHPPEGDTFSQSDSTTYYEDMILCSDVSTDEDDDSEPILGQWFEETLAPPESNDGNKTTNVDKTDTVKAIHAERGNSIVPERGEANGFITLATSIFSFLNRHLLLSKSSHVAKYLKNGISEQQMVILAVIIRDLDRETARTEVGTISVYFGQQLGQLYGEFSGALARFTHNLVTHQSLQSLQTSLLGHLGVSPWNSDVPHGWPLQVYSRSLAVLAQVLCMKPTNEKEASVISIWHRLVNTLIENVLNASTLLADAENDDLNVEHAQVLVYLFYSLNLMQKKSVVLSMAGGLLRCAEVVRSPLRDSQLLHLSRLLLLFDYIMKHLYDPPQQLIDQIQFNLFSSTHLNSDKDKENNMARMYTPWRDIEDNFPKINREEFSMKPRFYVLAHCENKINPDAPKLDGLACNFILATQEKVRYPMVIDALIEILNVTNVTNNGNGFKTSPLGLCAAQYCFTIAWKLLLTLPPSLQFFDRLATGELFPSTPTLLYSFVWAPRSEHKTFSRFVKESLTKQGSNARNIERILKSITENVNTSKHDVNQAKNCIQNLMPDCKKGTTLAKENLPPIWQLYLLHCSIGKLQTSLHIESSSASNSAVVESSSEIENVNVKHLEDFLPQVIRLAENILQCMRSSLLHTIIEQHESGGNKASPGEFDYIQEVLTISSTKSKLTVGLIESNLLPSSVNTVLQQWNESNLDEGLSSPPLSIEAPEAFIMKIVDAHMISLSSLSYSYNSIVNLALKRLLSCLISFVSQYAPKVEASDTKSKAIDLLITITLDSRTEFLYEVVDKVLDKLLGDSESEEYQKKVFLQVLDHSYKLITSYTSCTKGNFNEKILHGFLKFYEKLLEKPAGRQAMEMFFVGDKDLVKVLMSVSNQQMSQQYGTKVLHFFNKLFNSAEKMSSDQSLNSLCSTMSKLANVEGEKLQMWLKHIIIGPTHTTPSTPTALVLEPQWPLNETESTSSVTPNEETKNLVQENSQLLQAITNFIVKQSSNVSEEVATTILRALLPLGTHVLSSTLEGSGFTDLMVVMIMLADAVTGRGHIYLFPVISEWLDHCKRFLTQKDVIEKLGMDHEKNCVILDAAICMMEYLSDVINGILSQYHLSLQQRPVSPPWESETPLDQDLEYMEETNDEEDSGEESDEDSLCNKLCTYTVTQKEFMNQHWYHCHTCRMLDGVGVCSICARVCHKGHDVTYAKYGNFFCDCGAKVDNSCQALTKRSPQSMETVPSSTSNNTGFVSEDALPSSLRKKEASPIFKDKVEITIRKERRKNTSVKQLSGCKDWILNYLGGSNVPAILLDLIESLLPAIEVSCSKNSSVGCYTRALKALQQLHEPEKKYLNTDQLMNLTLGSQEGAFENVRMSYSGDQGQTIRQLLSAHIIRRVTMCCMSSPQGKRQHLAVAHEKGKIIILQLSALLKQADASTRKLTITRLASAPIPFTVLSLTSNNCNDDYLAVCGLKDCHVLTFNSAGSVVDHLMLHTQLATGNFIIKALWLPGSQTQLALITADFVKIYDLAKDALSPHYYFLVPSGKIRDCTFMYDDNSTYNILLMSSPGYIYTESLSDETSATHGPFYVTNTLEMVNFDIVPDANGQVAGGGVSIYYSHTLKLLFYSYAQGKSFVSPMEKNTNRLSVVFPINLSSGTKSNGGKTPAPQPLCQWTEIANHPGLVCSIMQSSNNPVVLMIKPDSLLVQEVKVTPSKSKIMDMVAIRHSSGSEQRTTLILLCEDGSLKIYMANMDQTGFWMSPSVKTTQSTVTCPKPRKKKAPKIRDATGKTPALVSFPVDFFEHCTPINDVEIGGNDLLQIYNVGQLKHRLNTSGLYVVCTKPLGFTVEITNNDNNTIMCGIRVLMGIQDPQRVPTYVNVFGRNVMTTATRSRWFDIPFSREESLQADKKITISFGPSQDPESISVLESIKVYGKTKEAFGWPEESEENVAANPASSAANGNAAVEVESSSSVINASPVTKLDKFVSGIVEVLDGTFSLYANDDKMASHKSASNSVAIKLLTLPTPPALQIHSTSLLSSLYSSPAAYHVYKDHAMLQHVLDSLMAMSRDGTSDAKRVELDAECYYRLVLIVRGIAVSRPQNLVKFTDSNTSIQDVVIEDPLELKPSSTKPPQNQHLLLRLMEVLWLLHSLCPENPTLAPVVVSGLKHTEQIIFALVEIVHAFNSCDSYSNITIGVYLQLLLCQDPTISFSAKHALSRVLKPKCKRRRVYIPSPPHCASPHAGAAAKSVSIAEEQDTHKAGGSSSSASASNAAHGNNDLRFNDVEAEILQMFQQTQAANLGGASGADNHNVRDHTLEAFLGAAGGPSAFQPLLDIPLDADDDTMVELAIALSLQEHDLGDGPEEEEQASLEAAAQEIHNVQVQEVGGHFSDTTASAAGSDDEGSTAATDGSTLRTSPAEQGGSAGSESGGSGVESIIGEHNVSGRSSTYGDHASESATAKGAENSVGQAAPGGSAQKYQTSSRANDDVNIEEQDSENTGRLHVLRLHLLERLIEYLPKLRNVSGIRAIPFFQVVLQLANDLDAHSERDKACLNALLSACIIELQISKPDLENICERSNRREVQLIIMRLLGVLMTRWKNTSATKQNPTDNSSFVASSTANALLKADFINYCLKVLQSLLDYWKESKQEETGSSITGNLLKEHLHQAPPDMSPFFLKPFVKVHALDIFHVYPQLLTEMALRLPYQVHKHSEMSEPISVVFETAWFKYLCEYMMFIQIAFVRRLVRKLLMFICGSKDKYRQLRDIHALSAHMKAVRSCCVKGGFKPSVQFQHAMCLPYDTLVEMVEHLKACLEIATSRVGNWQKFCLCHSDTLPFLFQVSCILDEGVAPTILQLLNCAIVMQTSKKAITEPPAKPATVTSRKEREKSDDSIADAAFEEASCVALVEQINFYVPADTLARFVRTFILETNHTTIRWQAHSLILSLYKNSKLTEKEALLQLLWRLWPLLPTYGRKAAQFVDLLGFFSLKMSQNADCSLEIANYVDKAVDLLRAQNEVLSHHPNANLYAHLSQYVELEGYYLESDPCLVCNNPEVPLTTIKLSSIKVDSKFTTTTHIVKLLSSHTISRITIRIGDLKRTKMVRTVNIHYNNRNVQAVVELKNKPALWHKAKKVNLQSGQTEVKIEFPLPIVACNLMIEYADFYENIQASSETLQCPRCSAAVPANPGVCSNCGENVFQCHKCRAINYDEKDPFLCHACGFCKYAKFDFILQAKSCCAVEPIENDDDRKKMISRINSLLEKADRVYKQLMGNKPSLEQLVLKVTEQKSDKKGEEGTQNVAPTAASVVSGALPSQVKVNKTIQMIAQQYCHECKSSFEELSKIIQKVLVSRKELVAYDRKHRDCDFGPTLGSSQYKELPSNAVCAVSNCYGCATAATEHCLTLLRALAINATLRQVLCSKGLIQELLANNLRKGSVQIQEEVRQLLCILSKENGEATEELCNLITERVTLGLTGQTGSLSHVRHEIALLAALQQIQDDFWETRLRSLVSIFLKACDDARSPMVIEAIILPCLQIWYSICKPKSAPENNLPAVTNNNNTSNSKKAKDKANNDTVTPRPEHETIPVDVNKWIEKDPTASYQSWVQSQANHVATNPPPADKDELHRFRLAEKYFKRWRQKVHPQNFNQLFELKDTSWVKTVLFNSSSRAAREIVCKILKNCCSNFSRKKQIIKMLTNYLSELSTSGENASEYLDLYCMLLLHDNDFWLQYMAINGVIFTLANLITKEIEQLHRLEQTTLSSDLTQGYALNQFTEVLVVFIEDAVIHRVYKSRLVGTVLNGYLNLRRLVVQRTRLIDDTQEKLLIILEELTTGTEEETRAFMQVCMQTVEKCPLRDVLTPVFIFERLCSIIYPEENDIGEFFLTLEKDPQQEDFLQGRMLGNPYSCMESGLGPLMRDVKNKICQDCELVALLEDDNGMELLVNNKIMSLDLPVKDVYKKVWMAEGGEMDSMRVIYRMRGLLGDATEEFVETLSNKSQATVDNEEVFKMANVLAECGGLKIMVERLGSIKQNVWRSKPLLQVLLKLFRLSVKVGKVQEVLCQPDIGAMPVFLRTLQLCLEGELDSSQASVTEQLLDIMETILARATGKDLESFRKFSQTFGGPEYVQSLLNCTTWTFVRNNQTVLVHLTRVLAALVYGHEERMKILLEHFQPVLDFNKYNFEHSPADQQKLEMFCGLTEGIERNAIGNTLKDYIIELKVVQNALDYITIHAPSLETTLVRKDSDELKEFISKPALKYILRFLTGMSQSHENTQLAVSQADTIPIIHRLEQVSSDEHVGSLAENLLEALKANADVAEVIKQVRDSTRLQKKRLAMAMREKELGQLGMRTNDKGQVTAKSTILQQMEELGEETGLVCCICREGYKYQPTKVLAIYTFTKRCNVEEFEWKARKTVGYSTVTHFNIVHVDCHMNAVRLARARDEWESAALQNANTKCNGLLPLWGPLVPESAFASCLARHNTYLQESTSHRDIGHSSTVHDLKHLLLRFAQEKSFHEDTGGGGPQSNMHMVPYLIHMALYVINTTRASKKEETNLTAFLEQTSMEKWIESAYEADGPLYWVTMAVILQSPQKWAATRLAHLKRLLICAHVRSTDPSGPTQSLSDTSEKGYCYYKPCCIFFGLVDGIYNYFFKKVTVSSDDQWSCNLADYIRHNDESLIKGSEKLLAYYTDELVTCASFAEFCDVCGLLEDIEEPDAFISNLLQGLL